MDWNTLLCDDRQRPTTKLFSPERTAFDADYERIVFTTSVRRLQDKAQVFPLDEHDAVRTRLTHSLEVSTLARSLARQAMARIQISSTVSPSLKPTDRQIRDIEVIAATAGLVHDLGNPPFGHAGEDAIQEWFGQRADLLEPLRDEQQRQDFLSFEGNAQTIRQIGRLQVLVDDYGLNLTYGTLSAASKYVAPSDQVDTKKPKRSGWKKPGYFASEADLIGDTRKYTGTGDARNPIAFLVEAADDLVYLACDLEDAAKKGLFSRGEIEAGLRTACKQLGLDMDAIETLLRDTDQWLVNQAKRSMASTSDTPDDVFASMLRIQIHTKCIPSVLESFHKNYESIMCGSFDSDIVSDGNAKTVLSTLREFESARLYNAKPTPRLEVMGRRVIHDLLDLYWEGAESLESSSGEHPSRKFSKKIVGLMSPNYIEIMKRQRSALSNLPERYHTLRLLTDFVCGMTDTFAQRRHRELFNG